MYRFWKDMETYDYRVSDDGEDSTSLLRGKRHNFSYLQLDQYEMENHLDSVFFSANEVDDTQDMPAYDVHALSFCHNQLSTLPRQLASFQNLRSLDLSSNQLTTLDESLLSLRHLRTLMAKNNMLEDDCLPKDFGFLRQLTDLNLSGNRLTTVCPQIFELENLRYLHIGGNDISHLSGNIGRLHKTYFAFDQCMDNSLWKEKLEVLYVGGNKLKEIPAEVGRLHYLEALILCENQLESIPPSISQLKRLRSLALHKNCLTTLPPDIVTLKGLTELSLRDNPLVVRFVKELTYDPPTLLELAARCIKTRNISVHQEELPPILQHYLHSAQRCVNPKCKGVYFDVCVQHIKFVDFCGKYRIPLLQYLCSPKCRISPAIYNSDADSSEDETVPVSRLKKVLLG